MILHHNIYTISSVIQNSGRGHFISDAFNTLNSQIWFFHHIHMAKNLIISITFLTLNFKNRLYSVKNINHEHKLASHVLQPRKFSSICIMKFKKINTLNWPLCILQYWSLMSSHHLLEYLHSLTQNCPMPCFLFYFININVKIDHLRMNKVVPLLFYIKWINIYLVLEFY